VPKRETYREKRSFDRTPEPAGEAAGDVDPGSAPAGESFVIHQHHATRLHFDLRLEMMNGDTPVLVSWAIPKNLPLRKGEPRLAVHVEDHPFEYATFSGTIPKGNYGAGEVRIFDAGTYEVLEQGPGKLTVRLRGERMQGVWHLNRTRAGDGKDEWLAILSSDERPEREAPPEPSPMLATLTREPFDREGWIFEPKWDGVRTLAVCSDETVLFSRTGRDITAGYPELAKLHERLVANEAIVDSEIVSFDGGRPSFERLQARINLQNPRDIEKMAASSPVTFVAFDLVYLDGRSLVDRPLHERRELLDDLVVPSARVQVSPHVEKEGLALFENARERGLEGVVAKRATSPYRPGKRSRDWLKVKVVHDADVVIGGWSPGEGARSTSFGALLAGAYDDGDLVFLGAVGTGYTDKSLKALLPALQELETDECPFAADPTGSRAGSFGKPLRHPRWIEPVLVARVEFRELTSANKLRAPSFKGLRTDKSPEDCTLADLRPAGAP
jgi:bifunctional non-homologous end joining protein LigD